MAKTTGDFLLERLSEWNVERVFGFPGDGINGILAAYERNPDCFSFVQTRHEEEAAFMACAHAKYTGEVGVCLATSGPGAIHLLNGLYDAKLDHQPVVAIVGQQARSALGGSYQQEVDLQVLFKDVAHEFCQTCMAPAQLRHLVDRAFRIAAATRSPTCIIIPNDVQEEPAVEKPPHAHGTVHSSVGFHEPKVVPQEDDLKHAARILNEGEKVGILIGAGALGAEDEVIALADTLGAGVAKALLGKAALPDDLPFVTGQIGLLGTEPTDYMIQHCDTFLMIGSSFPYSEFLPKEGDARGVQIDIDGKMLSIRYPMEIGLVGDTKATIKALLPHLERKQDRSWREKLEKKIADWWESVESKSMLDADPVNPELVFWELSKRLPENAIISADSGSSANWFARALKLRRGMKATLSGTLATMCPGVPYTTAAKFAFPERVCIGFVGDGAMQMLGINGLITISKYWKRWADPRLVICVLNNQDLNQVTWEQRIQADSPKVEQTQDLPLFPFAEYAELVGLKGIRVDSPDQVAQAWQTALGADRPVVIDVLTDANVPTIPPHITSSQVKSYATAFLKGDPNAAAMAWQTIKRTTH